MAAWVRSFGPWMKTMLVIGGGLLIGISTYGLLIYWEKREKFQDEGFEDVSRVELQPERKIVVLGLDGAGKSSFISNLSQAENDVKEMRPTEGFHVKSVSTKDTSLYIWEIGGTETFRSYWGNFLQDTDTLVFVVDSHDAKRLPQAYDEFKKLVADDRLKNVPILILANKQDIPNALTSLQIEEALNLKSLSPKTHRIQVLPMEIRQGKPQHPSVKFAEDTMIKLAFCD